MSDTSYQRGTSASPQTARAVLASIGGQVAAPGATLAKAAFTTAGPANSNLTFTARNLGTGGNSVTVAYVVSGTSTPLSVSVSGSAITVNVATNGGGAATSTGSQVLAALTGSAPVQQLVDVQLAAANTGAGVVAAISTTPLAGGVGLGAQGIVGNQPLPKQPPIHYTYKG